MLSGEGGDELFGGYETYAADQLALRVGPAAARLQPLVELLPELEPAASASTTAPSGSSAPPPCRRSSAITAGRRSSPTQQRAALLTPRWQRPNADPLAPWRERFAETAGAPLLARLQDVDLGIYLADDLLVKTDRMSMAHSLEARVPYP